MAVRRTLNGGNLTVPDDLSALVARGTVTVAVAESVIGTLVARPGGVVPPTDTATAERWTDDRGHHVEAIAVTRGRQGNGVGTALLDRLIATTDGPVTARFRPAVRPFYEAAGFDIRADDRTDRLYGVSW